MLNPPPDGPLEILPASEISLRADEERVVPAIAVDVTEIMPLSTCLQYLESGKPSERAHTVGVKAPTINWVSMFKARRRRDDATDAVDGQHAGYFEHRDPEVLDVLKRLTRYNNVNRRAGDFVPYIRTPSHDIHVGAGNHIEANIGPRWRREDGSIAAIDVLTSHVKDRQAFM